MSIGTEEVVDGAAHFYQYKLKKHDVLLANADYQLNFNDE